jgi:uncharacterized protein YyaL (SSP411 family)
MSIRPLLAVAFVTCVAVTLPAAAGAQNAASAPAGAPAAPAVKMITPPPAQTMIDDAVAAAKVSHKNVLAEFGASWCTWCHSFENFLADATGGKIMRDNFELVHLVVDESPDKKALENPGSSAMKTAMGGEKDGIPFFFFLDANGQKIADSEIMPDNGGVGHPNTPEEVAAFDKLLQKVAPNMTADQRTVIHDDLTKMAADRKVMEDAARAKAKIRSDSIAKVRADSVARVKAAGGGGN